MPLTFPSISFGRRALYPLTRSTNFSTKVLTFLNGQEQRWVGQTVKQEFELVFTAIDGYSVSVVREFWNSVHGADITPWTLNLGTDPVTHASMKYNNLVFVDDDFMITTDAKPNRYILTLKVRQIS